MIELVGLSVDACVGSVFKSDSRKQKGHYLEVRLHFTYFLR